MTQHKASLTRLHIAGFKSFADELHLDILPGLTGIVGPNGCGKSNIVEALRWIMGESSARALRGGDNEDLIFAGTSARPARNLAKVTLHLQNARHLAPAPFAEADELEVSRHIERGSGSTYRINQRVMRARDVQTLFADLSSGARSSSIISQNHVSQIINQRPEERRALLDEAAGITGLHVRRQDAERKLKQTEANLERSEERRLHLEAHLTTLSEQSQHARRYRELSDMIRQCELHLLTLQHSRADKAVQNQQQALHHARHTVDETEQALRDASRLYDEQAHHESRYQQRLAHLRAEREQCRVRLTVARHNLEHAQNTQKDIAAERERLQHDDERHRHTQQQLEAQRDHLTRDIAALSQEAHALPPQYHPLEETIKTLTQDCHTQEKALQDLNKRHHDDALQRESLNSLQHAHTQHYEKHQQALHTLQHECRRQEKLCHNQTALHDARDAAQHAAHALKRADDDKQAAHTHQHDAHLQAELAARAYVEAQTRLEEIQHHIRTHTRQLERLHQQQSQNEAQRRQARTSLLDETDRHDISHQLDQSRRIYQRATEHERACQTEKDAAEQTWLSLRAHVEQETQRRHVIQEEITHLTHREQHQIQRLHSAQHAAKQAQAALPSHDERSTAHTTLNTLEQQRAQAYHDYHTLQETVARDAESVEHARMAFLDDDARYRQCSSECEGLRHSLDTHEDTSSSSLIHQLHIPEDLTKALASALSEGLEASLDETLSQSSDAAPPLRQWRTLPALNETASLEALPTLADHISAPDALHRALTSVFIVETHQQGNQRHHALRPGQSLVCRDGTLWRWDGFVRSHRAPSPEAIRLEQQQHLRKQQNLLKTLHTKRSDAEAHLAHVQNHLSDLTHQLKQCEETYHQHDERLVQHRRHVEEIEQRATLQQEQLALAQRHVDSQRRDLEEIVHRRKTLEQELESLPDHGPDLQKAERTALLARERVQAAHKDQQDKHHHLLAAEKHYEQALLQHDAAHTRLRDLEEASKHLQNDILAQEKHRRHEEQAQENIDLEALARQKEKAFALSQKAQHHYEHHVQRHQRLYQEATQARETYEQLQRDHDAAQQRYEALCQQCRAEEDALASLKEEKTQLDARYAALPDIKSLEKERQDVTTTLNTLKESLEHSQQRYDHLRHQETLLKNRLDHYRQQHTTLLQTWNHLDHERKRLHERLTALQTQEHDAALPQAGKIQEDMDADTRHLATLEDEIAHEERHLTQCQKDKTTHHTAIQKHQERLRHWRDELTKINTRLEHAEQTQQALRRDAPLPESTPLPKDLSTHTESSLRRELKRYFQDREALGPVNLCAEEAFHTTKHDVDLLTREYQELTTAIARLRGGIGAINRQGRDRLRRVFDDINHHFQALFERMFGGGKAHLRLTGSDDPLDAGLEIFAQPPGKKLSTLSLLSGGEQALTALSLIFAAFHCTPAPICVLDEVDAPLDDANIERFCTLLTDMTHKTNTRFLIVTHHQLTMAHMDRLFGVTMQERGVSRLLSVNLDESIRMASG